jgi:Ulp1 family protease
MDKLFISHNNNFNYEMIKTWTKYSRYKKMNIFDKDFIFIPINYKVNIHFFLCVVCSKQRKICYFNSLNLNNSNDKLMKQFGEVIVDFLIEEAKDQKLNITLDNFELINMDNYDCPKQDDFWNCGVYTTMWMDFISNGYDFKLINPFTVYRFRLYMALSIKQGDKK